MKILKKHGADYDDRGGSILFDPPRGPAKSELMKALKKAGADPFRRFRTGRYTVNIG